MVHSDTQIPTVDRVCGDKSNPSDPGAHRSGQQSNRGGNTRSRTFCGVCVDAGMSRPVRRSASRPVSQSASRPVGRSASRPVSQSASRPVCRLASPPVGLSACSQVRSAGFSPLTGSPAAQFAGCVAWGPKSAIRNPKSAIHNPQSEIRNPQSSILNPQSTILNPQSAIHLISRVHPDILRAGSGFSSRAPRLKTLDGRNGNTASARSSRNSPGGTARRARTPQRASLS